MSGSKDRICFKLCRLVGGTNVSSHWWLAWKQGYQNWTGPAGSTGSAGNRSIVWSDCWHWTTTSMDQSRTGQRPVEPHGSADWTCCPNRFTFFFFGWNSFTKIIALLMSKVEPCSSCSFNALFIQFNHRAITLLCHWPTSFLYCIMALPSSLTKWIYSSIFRSFLKILFPLWHFI